MKKKKGMKRVFVLFLALTMSLSFFQITSFADEGSVADDPTKEEVLQLEETEEITLSDQTTTSAGSNDETTAAVSDETTDETNGSTGGETPDETSDDNTPDDSTTDESTGSVCRIGEIEYASLGEALDKAEAGAEIVLLKDVTGNIVLSNAVTVDLNGKTLAGDGTDSVVKIRAAGVVLKNGIVTGGSATSGGGINVSASGTDAIQLQDLTISGNTATNSGGGVYLDHGILEISGCTLTGNTADNSGGGVYQATGGTDQSSRCILTGSEITGNTAKVGGGLGMGATNYEDNSDTTAEFIMESGAISQNNSMSDLSKDGGGGVYLVGNGSRFTMNGGSITNNTTTQKGGGIYSTNWHGVTLNGGQVSNNQAGALGGGVYIENVNATKNPSDVEVLTIASGVEICGNSAGTNGGGIAISGAVTTNVAAGAALYNNTAVDLGDDVYQYNSGGALTLPQTSQMSGNLRLASDGYGITGWYYDGYENSSTRYRWGETYSNIILEYDENGKVDGYHKEKSTYYKTFAAGTAFTGTIALKAAHEPIVPIEGDSEDWTISKSKTATNLDSNFLSQVTLSLPSAEEALTTDVVFVLDKSTSASVEDQILNMLSNLKTEAEAKDAKVNVGVVIFNKQADIACGLTDLATGYDTIEAAIKKTITSGTNLHAGLLAGKAMLDADTETAASRKYLITVSDGITYMFGEEPMAVAWTFKADTVLNWAGPDNWESKYGTNDAPTDWTAWLSTIASQIQADAGQYNYPYGGTVGASTPVEEQDRHANSIDTALYKSYETYQSAKAAGYHCYATTATQAKGDQYDWGPSFMNYLANGEEVDFTSIEKEILYLLDAGSTITDKIGKTNDYDFDMVNLQDMTLKVGAKEYKAVATAENVYTFGEAVNDVYPYVVIYHPETADNNDEYFDWEINVPVSNLERVQLTYTVKLMNPKSEPGTYGEYDFDGSKNKAGLYTNNEAILYPVDSNGDKGLPEKFNKPTVSYTVSEPYVPPTPPVYTTSATVQKVWKLDDGGTAAASVQIELLRNGEHYDTQILSAANGWKYTWTSLPLGYTWMVKEVNAPEGFTTSISSVGNYFTVTNDDVEATPIVPDDPDDPNNPNQPDNPDNPAKPDQPTNPGTVTEPEGQGPEQPANPDQPKTGDESQLALYLFGLLGAAGTMCIMIRRRRTEK